jgi:hypothetical protein
MHFKYVNIRRTETGVHNKYVIHFTTYSVYRIPVCIDIGYDALLYVCCRVDTFKYLFYVCMNSKPYTLERYRDLATFFFTEKKSL